ncbi:hypothetical protein E8E12_003199 [Didymella heteroderae]|uniref:Oxidoreductase n=1 Tax=Didymella heteroderae TaxID=1769908 RepID=A0A9P4WQJ4_9PLEO|nr:hypothetical protein E8E12_003199 [Didymella heteroderae]
MASIPAETGYAFVGLDNLHNDIYPAISAAHNPSLHQPGKVVLITGAGRGIGRAIARQYAHANVASIILCARTASQLDEVESAIKSINSETRVHKHSIDVTSESAVASLAGDIAKKEDRLDILVNNAGYSARWIPIHLSEPEDWWRSFEVNLKGPYLLTRAFLPLLLKTAEKTGHVDVVNLASIGAHQVNAVASNYTMSKLGVCRLTENIDVGYKDKGLNAISVNPGGVETELASKEIDILKPYLNDTAELPGGFTVWLTAEPRKWLGGRYVAAPWDVEALTKRKDEIMEGDKLKVKLVV